MEGVATNDPPALLLGPLAAVAGGLVGAALRRSPCLADGLPWAFAGWWSLRGAFAGLAAGAIMGAISGIYHVEEPAVVPAPALPRKRPVRQGAFLHGRLLGAFHPGGPRPQR